MHVGARLVVEEHRPVRIGLMRSGARIARQVLLPVVRLREDQALGAAVAPEAVADDERPRVRAGFRIDVFGLHRRRADHALIVELRVDERRHENTASKERASAQLEFPIEKHGRFSASGDGCALKPFALQRAAATAFVEPVGCQSSGASVGRPARRSALLITSTSSSMRASRLHKPARRRRRRPRSRCLS